ncbi:MAG: DUF2092 domain-containing protein [Methyloprofundus sp.]|nr:DUF2092 domain-containing protein [Methyloprofundus sp.]
MTRRNAISLLLSAGLTASCSTVADKPANSTVTVDSSVSNPVVTGKTINTEQNLAMDAKKAEEKATAIEAMQIMSSYLRSLDKFIVNADVSFDEVLPNGQKVLLNKTVQIKADMPSNLWAKSENQYSQREFYFNGQTFTLYTENLGYFASVDVPGTIGEAVIKANLKYDIEVPLVDLFLWGTTVDSSADVNEAIIVGVEKVNGVECNQFAFREKDIDWQICIQRDDTPLPLKLVITEKDLKAQPQMISVLKWDIAPDLSKQNYTFTPHSGDHKISFGKVLTDK